MTTISSKYSLVYTSPGGTIIPLGDLSTLDYARRIGDIGTLSVLLAGNYPVNYFEEDGILKVYRSAIPEAPGKLDMHTWWQVQTIEIGEDDDGREYCSLGAVDATNILNRHCIPYYGGTAYTGKVDTCDNLMKAFIRENYGALVFDTARDLSAYISVEADTSEGPAVEITGVEWRCYILDVLNELRDDSIQLMVPIYFDLMPNDQDNTLVFQTFKNYIGVDRTISGSSGYIILDDASGALRHPKMRQDYQDERNYVYAKGRGEGTAAFVKEVSDPVRIAKSVFNRRETVVNDSNAITDNEVIRMGNAALRRGRPRIVFEADIAQTPGLVYGIDYGYGDAIMASYKGYTFPCVLDNARVQVNSDGEKVTIRAHGEFYIGA